MSLQNIVLMRTRTEQGKGRIINLKIDELIRKIRRHKIVTFISVGIYAIMISYIFSKRSFGPFLTVLMRISLLEFLGAAILLAFDIENRVRRYLYLSYRDAEAIREFAKYKELRRKKLSQDDFRGIFSANIDTYELLFQLADVDEFAQQVKPKIQEGKKYPYKEVLWYWYWMALYYYRKGDLLGVQDAYQHFQKEKAYKYVFLQNHIIAENIVTQKNMFEVILYLLGDEKIEMSNERILKIFTPRARSMSLKNYYWRGMLYLKAGRTEKGLQELKSLAENGGDFWDARMARDILDEHGISYSIKEKKFDCEVWNLYRKAPGITLIIGGLMALMA